MSPDYRSPKPVRGMMQPASMTRAEWCEALLRILTSERRYSPAAARQYRLAMWVLGREALPR